MATAKATTDHDEIRNRVDWFEAFDRNGLAFLYETKRNSRFSKLVNR